MLRAPLPRAPVPPSGEGPAPPHRDAERGGLERGAAALQPFWWRDAARQTWPWRRQPAEPAAARGDRERSREPPASACRGRTEQGAAKARPLFSPGINILTTKCAQKPRGQPSSSLLLKILQGVAALKDRGGSCASEARSGAGSRQPRRAASPRPGRAAPGGRGPFPASLHAVRAHRPETAPGSLNNSPVD